jgi:predicted DNA-binding transcriptional regulator AlpA
VSDDNKDKPANNKRALTYNPQSEIVRAEHWPLVTGLSSATLWRKRQAGQFVPVIKLGENSCGARRRDLDAWLEARSAR